MSIRPAEDDFIKSSKKEAIKKELVEVKEEVARVYKDKNHKVKKALSFSTKNDRSKLA